MTTQRALVLGGGGVAAIAWETGVLAGVAERGVDVGAVDHLVGTSAGAVVGAQLRAGMPLAEMLRRQTDPALQNHELTPTGMSTAELMRTFDRLIEAVPPQRLPQQLPRRIGEMALNAETVPEPVRRAVIAGRLPSHTWPDGPRAVTAVDAYTGELRVFDKHSGVDLVDAVAASCAVPGMWPPVSIGGTRFIDGMISSATIADLAAGYARVLVLAPMHDLLPIAPALTEQVARLRESAQVEVITPDEASVAAFGGDAMDPASRTSAARAGYAQGQRVAAAVSTVWQES
jgi:NTE family protein